MRAHSRQRRAFLKSLGTLGASLPFARLLASSAVEAAEPAPLRFLALFTPHGMVPEYWTPQGTETAFNITYPNAMLAPLERHRSKILVLDGLDYRVLYEHGQTGHEGAPVTFLTGSRMVSASGAELPESASIDQVLAEKVGASTKFRSLEVTAFHQYSGQHVYNSISFTSTGQRVPSERNPANVYNRLFKDLAVGAPSPEVTRQLQRRRSLLDYLIKDVGAMQSRLAGAERAKLDSHLTALRDIERRLATSGVACGSKPAQPPSFSSSAVVREANAPELVRLHLDLVAQAFACDLTRVATMTMLAAPSMPWIGITDNIHDDIAHMIDASDATARAAIRLKLAKVQAWYAEQVAYLMDKLAAIPEGDGTVLDHTLILWGNELGNPSSHSNLGVPTVLAGGANGLFHMGRYLKLRGPTTSASKAVPHNQLLVAIANAFGLSVNTFGHPAYSGALPNLS